MAELPRMTPHTAAKHLILKRYLDAWFPILGRHHKRINYIDGFAGPGKYETGEIGSPIIAIQSAAGHIAQGTLSGDVRINFIFVEKRRYYYQQLSEQLKHTERPNSFSIQAMRGSFGDVISNVLRELKQAGAIPTPTFAFIDPSGFGGIPFDLVVRILKNPKCEVLINLMIDYINRFLRHPNDSVVRHFPETFGTQDVLSIPQRRGGRVAALLGLYRHQLQTVARYVGSFKMRNRRHRMLYSLFFASNSPKGFLKMKEAMWSVDKSQGQQFSNGDPHGFYQFDLFAFEPLWNDLLNHFRGQEVKTGAVLRYVSEQTDFLPKHARSILTKQETHGRIKVLVAENYKRRQGTFNPDKTTIVFP